MATISLYIKHELKIIIHQLRTCKQKTTKISPFKAHYVRKSNTPLSVICTTPKLSTLSYNNFKTLHLDEDTVTPEAILTDDKGQNGFGSDIKADKSDQRG